MTFSDTIYYLYQLQGHGIRPGLERTTALLSLLNHPEKSFQSIHIGGTNGKGSTAAMVASVLKQSGYQVGLYTSPHLIEFSERILLCGHPIPENIIIRLTDVIRDEMECRAPDLAEEITFFEFTTVLAFLYFAESHVDFAVVEVGMGGQLDATNTLTPLVTAITQVDFDHEKYLGTTLYDIAKEKAGIFKEKVPIVTGVTQTEVCDLFEEIARSKHAPLFRIGKEIRFSVTKNATGQSGETLYALSYFGIDEYRIYFSLLGQHQIRNACVAMGIIESLKKQGAQIHEKEIIEGFKNLSLAGRLEVVRTAPLILLDVAHNPSGARALSRYLTEENPLFEGKTWMILGVMQDKNIKEILKPLFPWVDEFVFTQAEVERAAHPKEIAAELITQQRLKENARKAQITIREKVSDALSYVESHIHPQDRLVITGSFFTVGEARATLFETKSFRIRG